MCKIKNIQVTRSHTSTTYDVEFEGRNFSVIFNTDENIGYTDISVMEDGQEVEDKKLFDRVVPYVEESLR